MNRFYRRNDLKFGLSLGILIPAVGFGLLYGIFYLLDQAGLLDNLSLSPDFRLRTTAIVAIALNAIPMNKFQQYRSTQTMRGILIATGIFVLAWLYYFKDSLFQ